MIGPNGVESPVGSVWRVRDAKASLRAWISAESRARGLESAQGISERSLIPGSGPGEQIPSVLDGSESRPDDVLNVIRKSGRELEKGAAKAAPLSLL